MAENAGAFIKYIDSLPAPSAVLQRINAVLHNPDSSAQDVVDALKLEPSIVARVLRLANSAYIGLPRTVSSLQNAVVLLGQKRIGALVRSASMLSRISIDKKLPIRLESFWRHSIAVGMIAESIARHLRRYTAFDPDEIFSAAIMHDIGKLVLARYEPPRIVTVIDKSRATGVSFFSAESDSLPHTVAGEYLGRQWNFPQSLIKAVAGHHAPIGFEQKGGAVSIVHLADVMAHTLGFHLYSGEVSPPVNEQVLNMVALPFERLRVIGEEILKKEKELTFLLDVFS